MALLKMIIQPNGIPTEYHRIYNIENIINEKTVIKVYSYVNEEQRERDKNKPKYSIRTGDVYIAVSEEEIDYNDTLTVDDAYEYLKTLDKYSGAKDI